MGIFLNNLGNFFTQQFLDGMDEIPVEPPPIIIMLQIFLPWFCKLSRSYQNASKMPVDRIF